MDELKSGSFLVMKLKRLIHKLFYLIIITGVSSRSDEPQISPPPTCPGDLITFTCVVCDPSAFSVTVFNISRADGEQFLCSVFNGNNGTCDPDHPEFTVQSEAVIGGCYSISLTIPVSSSSSSTNIECSRAGSNVPIGSVAVEVTPPATSEIVDHTEESGNATHANVTLLWESKGENISSYTIASDPALPCEDRCVLKPGESGFENRQLMQTVVRGVEYAITVRADNCNDQQNGTQSHPYKLKVPLPSSPTEEPDSSSGSRGDTLTVCIALFLVHWLMLY